MDYAEFDAYRAAASALQAWARKATAALAAAADPDEIARIVADAAHLAGFISLVHSVANDVRQRPFSSRN